jgi:hypothetical protein
LDTLSVFTKHSLNDQALKPVPSTPNFADDSRKWSYCAQSRADHRELEEGF